VGRAGRAADGFRHSCSESTVYGNYCFPVLDVVGIECFERIFSIDWRIDRMDVGDSFARVKMDHRRQRHCHRWCRYRIEVRTLSIWFDRRVLAMKNGVDVGGIVSIPLVSQDWNWNSSDHGRPVEDRRVRHRVESSDDES
jgi:hypothetical protein